MRVRLFALVWLASLGSLAHAGSVTTTTTIETTSTTVVPTTTTTTLASTTSTTATSSTTTLPSTTSTTATSSTTTLPSTTSTTATSSTTTLPSTTSTTAASSTTTLPSSTSTTVTTVTTTLPSTTSTTAASSTTTLPSTTSTTVASSTTTLPSSTSTTVTTVTTTLPSTTSTTTSTTSTSSSTSTSTSSSSSTTSSTVPPAEQCGNCLDDDGDGLTDFEDADCCETPPGTLAVERLDLVPIGAVTRIKLSASGLPAVATLAPSTQTLVVQVAPDDAEPVLCASVHALHFRAKRDRATFADRSDGVPSAHGITAIGLQRLGMGTLRLTLRGARARFHTPAAERFRVTAVLRSLVTPGTPARCVTQTVDVVAGKGGGFGLP